MKRLISIQLVLCLPLLAGCQKTSKIVGRWHEVGAPDGTFVEFFADGKVKETGGNHFPGIGCDLLPYKVEGGQLKLDSRPPTPIKLMGVKEVSTEWKLFVSFPDDDHIDFTKYYDMQDSKGTVRTVEESGRYERVLTPSTPH